MSVRIGGETFDDLAGALAEINRRLDQLEQGRRASVTLRAARHGVGAGAPANDLILYAFEAGGAIDLRAQRRDGSPAGGGVSVAIIP